MYLYNPHPYHDIECFNLPRKLHHVSFLHQCLSLSTKDKHCSDYFQGRLVLLILELVINGIIEYGLFCVLFLLLSIMFMRFICVGIMYQ